MTLALNATEAQCSSLENTNLALGKNVTSL